MWLDAQQEIADKFISEYTIRFRANRGDHRNLQDIQLNTSINDSDNESPIRLPSRRD